VDIDDSTGIVIRELSDPVVITAPGSSVVEVQLSDSDLRLLNTSTNFGTTPGDTYITLDITGVTDFAGFLLNSTVESNVIVQSVDEVVSDVSGPRVIQSTLNLNSGQLSLFFDEEATLRNVDAVSIVNLESSSTLVQLDSTAMATRPQNRQIDIVIPQAAINIINSAGTDQIAVSLSDDFVADIGGRPSVVSLTIPTLTEDLTAPMLTEWRLDLNSGLISLTFSESVDAINFNASSITLEDPSVSGSILQPTSVVASTQGRVLLVQLSPEDITSLKELGTIGLSEQATAVILQEGSVSDLRGNGIAEIPSTIVSNISPDTVSPQLLSFLFEYTSNGQAPVSLSLNFTEPINVSDIQLGEIQLYNAPDTSGMFYALTSSTPPSRISNNVKIILSNADLAGIFSVDGLGIDVARTYLRITSAAFRDVSAVAVTPTDDNLLIQVTPPLVDLLPPTLFNFTFNLASGIITFAFDMPVLADSIDGSAITVQSLRESSAVSYSFTGGSSRQENSNTVSLFVSQNDILGIKAVPGLATNMDTTFISLAEGLIRDANGHSSFVVPSNEALQASVYVPEVSEQPRLTSFSVDLTPGGFILLTFQEPVLASSFRRDQFTLQNRQSSPTVTFTFSSADPTIITDSAVIMINLDFPTRDSIVGDTTIATDPLNTFISAPSSAAEDRDGNPMEAILGSNALRASSVISGILPPTVQQFNLDLNTAQLAIQFDKTVQASTFDLASFHLQDADSSPDVTYSLISSFVNPVGNINSVTVSLTQEDLDNVKRNDLCDSQLDCFLYHESGAFADVFRTMALNGSVNVTTFVRDMVPPRLLSFDSIDIQTGRLFLTFNEPINASTFTPSNVVISSLFSQAEALSTYPLTGGNATSENNGIAIQLSRTDLVAIQADQYLCRWRGDCYVTLRQGAVEDPAGNPNGQTPEDPNMIVATFVTDVASPVLENFNLNLDNRMLSLTFSEAVNPQIFDPSGITVLSEPNGTVQYELTDSTISGEPSDVLTVLLSSTDSNALKNSSIIQSASEAFIAINSSAIQDLAFNPNQVSSSNSTNPIQGTLTPDNSAPALLGFNLDLTSDDLTLTFDEVVDLNQIDYRAISIASSPAATTFVRLSSGTVVSSSIGSTHVIVVELGQETVTSIKTTPGLADSPSDTFIVVSPSAFRDSSGNFISSETTMVETFQADTNLPRLVEFLLDMVAGTLELSFNDVVVANTLHPPAIVLQSAISRANSSYYRLTTTSFTAARSVDGYRVVISLSPMDVAGIKAAGGIGITENTTYITVQGDLVDDPYGQDNMAITDGKAIRASSVVPDATVVSLDGFSLNANTGSLVLTFDDVVDSDNFNVSGITIQTTANISSGDSYSLTNSSFERIGAGNEVEITLSTQDLNGVKSLLRIGFTTNDTFLSIASNVATDSTGNTLVSVPADAAMQSEEYRQDVTRPQLMFFMLDLNQATLILTFSETVDVSYIDPSGITLQNVADYTQGHNEISLTLRSGIVASMANSDVIRVGMLDSDFNFLTIAPDFGNETRNTFLSLVATSFRDTTGNRIVPVPTSEAVSAMAIIRDTTSPMLRGLEFSLDAESITLTFSEAVDVSTLDPTQILIQDSSNSSDSGDQRQLTGGQGRFVSPQVVELTLALEDIRYIRLSETLAKNEQSTFVSIGSDFIMDYGDNFAVSVPVEQAAEASSYAEDTSSPELVQFNIDLNANSIIVEFDEIIDPASINISLIASASIWTALNSTP